MRNPFPDNPVFKRFLGLKDYFKKYQTAASFSRAKEIARVARIVATTGDTIAFDILGSVNFGMAEDHSDIDLVMYIDVPELRDEEELSYENCPRLRFYQTLVLQTLVHEVSKDRYSIQVVDYINLSALERAIDKEDFQSEILARFIFYRTICRGVNKRVLHPIEKKIHEKPQLFHEIEEQLTEALIEFTRTSSHEKSFKKYIDRLQKKDIHIPDSIMDKVLEYLDFSKNT